MENRSLETTTATNTNESPLLSQIDSVIDLSLTEGSAREAGLYVQHPFIEQIREDLKALVRKSLNWRDFQLRLDAYRNNLTYKGEPASASILVEVDQAVIVKAGSLILKYLGNNKADIIS